MVVRRQIINITEDIGVIFISPPVCLFFDPQVRVSMAQMAAPARQATLPCESFWQAKLTTSGDLGNFLTHVTTFHDLCTTLTTNGDDILTTVKTNGEGNFTTLMTDGEDTLMTTFYNSQLPCDYPA
jgi:hypothetical protein